MTDQIPDISDLTTVARTASLSLAVATAGVKNRALEAIAIALEERSREILSANQLDLLRVAHMAGLSAEDLRLSGWEHPRPIVHRDDLAPLV